MQRRHDLDWVRVAAFALLVLYHVGMFYVADWDWHVKSAYLAEWLQWPMRVVNQWRMPRSSFGRRLVRLDRSWNRKR